MDKQRARRSASIPVRIGHAAAWAAGLWKQEHLRTLIIGAQRFVLCAVLAQGTILGGYMPFGLAMTAALMARGAGLSALGGLVCGVMLRGDGFHGGIYAAAALLVLCVMSVCAGLRVMSERWFAPGVATFASAACTFVFLPLGAELTAPAVLTFLLVQGITFGVCWIYGAAFAPPRDENDWRRRISADRRRARQPVSRSARQWISTSATEPCSPAAMACVRSLPDCFMTAAAAGFRSVRSAADCARLCSAWSIRCSFRCSQSCSVQSSCLRRCRPSCGRLSGAACCRIL